MDHDPQVHLCGRTRCSAHVRRPERVGEFLLDPNSLRPHSQAQSAQTTEIGLVFALFAWLSRRGSWGCPRYLHQLLHQRDVRQHVVTLEVVALDPCRTLHFNRGRLRPCFEALLQPLSDGPNHIETEELLQLHQKWPKSVEGTKKARQQFQQYSTAR